MPYIKVQDRLEFKEIEKEISYLNIETPGNLQYIISLLIAQYLREKGEVRYQHCNDIMGALTGANMEFYRQIVAPYEDICIERNGEVDGYNKVRH